MHKVRSPALEISRAKCGKQGRGVAARRVGGFDHFGVSGLPDVSGAALVVNDRLPKIWSNCPSTGRMGLIGIRPCGMLGGGDAAQPRKRRPASGINLNELGIQVEELAEAVDAVVGLSKLSIGARVPISCAVRVA